jgi:proline iminopeptidase
MNDDQYTIESGFLKVGNGHTLYFHRWGNKNKDPIFFLHGGPGGRCSDKNKLQFDPERHQVIFHDQRGSGQSTPFATIKDNTTQHLVSDIEQLRNHFSFHKINLVGHSWGSTLALLYAIQFPENIQKMLISGIFTGTQNEISYIQQGGLRTHYPDAWQKYIELVPMKHQDNTAAYYLEKMLHGSESEQKKFVARWNMLESSAVSIDSDFSLNEQQSSEYDEKARSLAIIEAHYFVHNCFIEKNFIVSNSSKLKRIEIVMVHGRYDHVCPPDTAYELAEKIGNNCHLHIVPAAHAKEAALREVQRAYAWSFLG